MSEKDITGNKTKRKLYFLSETVYLETIPLVNIDRKNRKIIQSGKATTVETIIAVDENNKPSIQGERTSTHIAVKVKNKEICTFQSSYGVGDLIADYKIKAVEFGRMKHTETEIKNVPIYGFKYTISKVLC